MSSTRSRLLRLLNLGPSHTLTLALAILPASPLSAQAPSSRVEPTVAPQFRVSARPLVQQTVDRARTALTEGAVHPEAKRLPDLGRVADSLPIEHIQLLLRRPAERQTAFDSLVDALHTPGNPSYRQWLTPEAVGANFGPAAADIAAVRSYLESEGFAVNFIGKSGMVVDFTGTAGQVAHSFHTEVHNLQTSDFGVRFSAVTDAQLPEALAPAVVGFLSLSNIPPHSHVHKPGPSVVKLPGGNGPTPMVTNGGNYYLGPQDFYTIYNENPTLTAGTTGSGTTIALIEETDINTADVTSFRALYNVLPNAPTINVMHGSTSVACTDPGITSTGEETEAVLDTEWAGAVAPGATLLYMSCKTSGTAGIFLSAEAVVFDNLASVLSLSYGASEVDYPSTGNFMLNLWEQAAAQGQTVVVSAGDDGSAGSADQNQSIATHGIVVNVLGSTPYNVVAGGTDFQDVFNDRLGDPAYGTGRYWSSTNGTGQVSALSYIPETTWNATCASSLLAANFNDTSTPNALCDDPNHGPSYRSTQGAGGGVSILHPRPSWQTGTVYGLPAASGVYNGRLLPDLSFFASAGPWGHSLAYYQADTNATPSTAGGTSFVAPQMAGLFALIAQKTGQRLGQPNYELYSLAGTAYGTTTFAGSSCNGSGASGYGVTTSSPSASCVFYDVQTGNTSQACTAGTANCYSDNGSVGILSLSTTAAQPAYNAGQGYDLATGLGSANITNLVNAWVNPTVTPMVPAITITPIPNPLIYGLKNFSIQITASGTNMGFAPLGTVGLVINSTSYGSYDLNANNCVGATCTAENHQLGLSYGTAPSAGTVLSSTYTYTSDDPAYYSNTSGSTSFTIQKQTPAVAVNNVTMTAGASSTSFYATITYTGNGAAPTGGFTITIDSGTPQALSCTGSLSPLTCAGPLNESTVPAGTHTITATYAGNSNYTTASATATLTVNAATQTITFPQPAAGTAGYTATLTATASSGLPVTYSITSGPATVSGSTVTYTGAGTVVIAANQAGNSTYSAAPTVSVTVTVTGDIVWALNGNGTLTKLNESGASLVPTAGTTGTTAAKGGLAFDSAGSVWSVTSAANKLTFVSKDGGTTTSYTGAGLNSPVSVAVDGSGAIWVANSGNNSVSEFLNTGTAQSGTSGYSATASLAAAGVQGGPSSVSIDNTGGVWVTNKTGSSVTHIFGAATPVTTPQSTAVTNTRVGVAP